MINLPFIFKFVPKRLISKFSNKSNVWKKFKFLIPKLKTDLFQADLDIKPENYINICVFSSLWFFVIFLTISTVILLLGFEFSKIFPLLFTIQAFVINILISLFLATSIFFYSINYPRLLAIKRVRELEKTLLTALRHVLIKIRSGVTLFNALASLSTGYGELSKEISSVVSKTNAGMPLTQALDEIAAKNPSIHFRRAIWQISNTLKVGADINESLSSIITVFSQSQIIKATKYGRELNMLSMFYMILTVIFPTLGVTFLIILSSFVGISINWFILLIILLISIIVQIFFLSIIRSRKPYMVT